MIRRPSETASTGAAHPQVPEPILALLAAADTTKGEALAKACIACHGFDKGGPNKVGPNLYGIVNGPKAHVSDFALFRRDQGNGRQGDRWTYQNLSAFLWKPSCLCQRHQDVVPRFEETAGPRQRDRLFAYIVRCAQPALPSEGGDSPAEAPKDEPKRNDAGNGG